MPKIETLSLARGDIQQIRDVSAGVRSIYVRCNQTQAPSEPIEHRAELGVLWQRAAAVGDYSHPNS